LTPRKLYKESTKVGTVFCCCCCCCLLFVFFQDRNKIDKPLAKQTRRHRDRTQTNKIRNEKGDIKTEIEEIKKKKSSDPTTKAYTQHSWKIWMK
jgi:hypothetical protein